MKNRHLPIVAAAAIALLSKAERLYASWESPGPDDTAACRVNAIAALPDGSLLAALAPESIDYIQGDDVPQLVRLEAEDGARTGLSFGRGFTLLAVDGGQGYAAAANRDTVVLFPVDDPESVEDQWDNAAQNSALAFLSDGGMLATGGRNAYVHVLRSGGDVTDLPLAGHAATVTSVASAGGFLFSASADGSVKIWDPNTGELRKTIRPAGGRIVGLQPGAGGRSLTAVLADGTGIVYDLPSYRAASTWETGLEAVALCASSPDGGLAALYDGAETVAVWDLAGAREMERVPVPAREERALTAVAFSADGGRLALGWSDGAVSARALESKVLGLLAKAGLTEAQRNSWLGERRLDAGNSKGIARAGRVLLEEGAAGDPDFRDAALLYLEAGDAAGMLSVAEAYAKADRPVLAAHWAGLAGDAKKAAAYRKAGPQGTALRVRLEAERTSDIESEPDGVLVVGDAEGPFDYLLTIREDADRIDFRIDASAGRILLEISDEGLDTEGHALTADLPTVVRQFLAE